MSATFVKERKQTNIYQPYAPNDGVCEIGDPSFIRPSNDLVSEDEKICYRLDPSTCPKLDGALVDVKWGETSPNVECTYSLDLLNSNEQVLNYVKIYGKDLYFQEVIMPKVFKFVTNQCPSGVNGIKHSSCLKILEESEVGRLCREWAKTHHSQADLIMKEYASTATSTDCDCINRAQDPYYNSVISHKKMKKVQPGDWYAPCQHPEKYLVTSDITHGTKKINKRVNAAVNYALHRSNDPRKYQERIDQFSDVPIKWDLRSRKTIDVVDVPEINQVRSEIQETDQTVVVPGEYTATQKLTENSPITRRYGSHTNTSNSTIWIVVVIIVIVIIIIIIAVIAVISYRNKRAARTIVNEEVY